MLVFMLLNDESGSLVQFIESNDFRAGGVAPKKFERPVSLLIYAFVCHELLQAATMNAFGV